MPVAWRIVKTRYASSAFDGEGARLFGGRWNGPGTRVVYCASSGSLAVLEVLVHLDRVSVLPSYSLISAAFDGGIVERLDRGRLQGLGDEWVRGNCLAALEVPSAVVGGEGNYLLNPVHPDFSRVTIGEPEAFRFDPRLLGDTPV